MFYPYIYIDTNCHLYCCRYKHVCFSAGQTEKMAKKICPEWIRYKKNHQASVRNARRVGY